jgi:hypothetical protein
MYTLDEIPTEASKVIGKLGSLGQDGVVGVKSTYEVIRLFPAGAVWLAIARYSIDEL